MAPNPIVTMISNRIAPPTIAPMPMTSQMSATGIRRRRFVTSGGNGTACHRWPSKKNRPSGVGVFGSVGTLAFWKGAFFSRVHLTDAKGHAEARGDAPETACFANLNSLRPAEAQGSGYWDEVVSCAETARW